DLDRLPCLHMDGGDADGPAGGLRELAQALRERRRLGSVECRRESRCAQARKGQDAETTTDRGESHQNIVLPLADLSGTTCNTSQCSTILPPSSRRKMSMPAQSWSPGQCWRQWR